MVTITASGGFEVTLQAKADASNVTLDLTGIGAMRMQIGANEGQALAIRIPEVSLKMTGLEDLSIATKEGADKAMQSVSRPLRLLSHR